MLNADCWLLNTSAGGCMPPALRSGLHGQGGSPHRRVGVAEYARRVILPNPGMDHPGNVSDKVATLFAALLLGQSVRVGNAGQRADIRMTVPVCQRFWEWRIQWLTVGPFGRLPK